MQRWLLVPLGLLLLTIVGCGMSSMPAQRPEDFALVYDWREGSLPPPYHYEYSITLTAKGNCELIMIPDYPAPDVPQWRELFQVPVADRDRLYQQLLDLGLFTQSWREETNRRVGGSSADLTVVANETKFEIPNQVVESQEDKAEEIYATIKAIVPPETWAKLEGQLKEYQDAHQR
ncbi:MAG TPA: hypothetical protein VGD58_13845 [Herpetosiphonaceae bacterium]